MNWGAFIMVIAIGLILAAAAVYPLYPERHENRPARRFAFGLGGLGFILLATAAGLTL